MTVRLTEARKDELAPEVLTMSVKGISNVKIAAKLKINRKTVPGLLKRALEYHEVNEDEEREKSLAHHRGIIKWCWEQLESEDLGNNAQNRPAYIARIQASQSEIDRLNNVTPPLKTESKVDVTHRQYEGAAAENRELDDEIAQLREDIRRTEAGVSPLGEGEA